MSELRVTTPQESGIEIGSGASRINCIDAVSCFADVDELERLGHDPEGLNSGIHGHMYTRPGDAFVFSVRYWEAEAARRWMPHLLEVNARLWRAQTGIELATSLNGRIAGVADERPLLDVAVGMFDPGESVLVPTGITSRLVDMLGARESILSEVAHSAERLNHKSTALRLLAEQGMRVPLTLSCRAEDVGGALSRVSGLARDRTYVLKADGLSSGFGVHLGDGRGYDVDGLTGLVERLRDQGRLPSSFQIQEFVSGEPLGAVAHFDRAGSWSLLSIAAQRTRNGSWVAGHWDRPLYSRHESEFRSVFDRIAALSGQLLLGSVGVDAMANGGRMLVMEVNARQVGSRPIGWLLAQEDRIRDHWRRVGSAGETFRIHCLDLDASARIRPELLEGYRLVEIVEGLVGDIDLRAQCPSRPLILPQGLDPVRPTRLVFVNDEREVLKRRFLELVGAGD